MLITEQQFTAMFPHASKKNIAKYFPYLEGTLKRFSINTPSRIAAFLAQIAVESGSLHYVEEIASGEAYDSRKDLGNTDPFVIAIAEANNQSVGHFYKGHGLMQITGAYNHRICGEALGLDLLHNPLLLTQPEHAWKSAGWYWHTHKCNAMADAGTFGKITKAINGAYNNNKDRIDAWIHNKQVLNCH